MHFRRINSNSRQGFAWHRPQAMGSDKICHTPVAPRFFGLKLEDLDLLIVYLGQQESPWAHVQEGAGMRVSLQRQSLPGWPTGHGCPATILHHDPGTYTYPVIWFFGARLVVPIFQASFHKPNRKRTRNYRTIWKEITGFEVEHYDQGAVLDSASVTVPLRGQDQTTELVGRSSSLRYKDHHGETRGFLRCSWPKTTWHDPLFCCK
jgi:hypothetical protein